MIHYQKNTARLKLFFVYLIVLLCAILAVSEMCGDNGNSL